MKTVLRSLSPLGLAAAALFTFATSAVEAQDDRVQGPLYSIGNDMWHGGVVCWECHGNMGNGYPSIRDRARGADFRELTLTVEQLVEVIRCGRPGTGMPYFGRNPYSGDNPCYGVTAEQLGELMPHAGETFNARQIDGLAQFIAYQFIGRGPATFEECTEFFGSNANSCRQWPTRAEVEAAAAAAAAAPAPAPGM